MTQLLLPSGNSKEMTAENSGHFVIIDRSRRCGRRDKWGGSLSAKQNPTIVNGHKSL